MMSNTQLEEMLAGQPRDVQDEIIRINTEARPRALQVALLVPLLAGLLGLAQLVPDAAPARPAAGGARRGRGPRLTMRHAVAHRTLDRPCLAPDSGLSKPSGYTPFNRPNQRVGSIPTAPQGGTMGTGITGAPPTSDGAPPSTPPPGDDKGPSRGDVLFRNKKRLLIALALVASRPRWRSARPRSSPRPRSNPENTFSAGTLRIDNSKPNAAILTATDMVPGRARPADVTITNTGERVGAFTLTTARHRHARSQRRQPLDGAAAEDRRPGHRRGGSTTTTSLTMSPARLSLGTWGGDEAHTYEFTVTFPRRGHPRERDDRRQRVPGLLDDGDLQLDAVSWT